MRCVNASPHAGIPQREHFGKVPPNAKDVVERAFRKLATNHDIIPLYNKCFVARLPTGEKLNVALSPQLEEAFKVLDENE